MVSTLGRKSALLTKAKLPRSFQSLRTFFFILRRERVFSILGITFLILLGGAILLYLLEHRVNKAVSNLGDALYWALISMTTTGYGDIIPSTSGGRIVAVIVVLSGLLLLSLITATVASGFVEKKSGRERDWKP